MKEKTFLFHPGNRTSYNYEEQICYEMWESAQAILAD
jgi:hypothetical protein